MDLFENERIDDLQLKGLRLIQNKNAFCFGVDAVLLSDFADVRKGDQVLDLGTGTGIIPVLLAGKTQAKMITGLEIQTEMANMAKRSIILNNLQSRVNIICGDIKNSVDIFGPSSMDVIVTNPPYMASGGGLLNPSDTKAVSRHEILCTLSDVIDKSSRLLVPGGSFFMIHRPHRLADIICLMRAYKLEPKIIRFVHPSIYKKPNLLLIKGTRGGGNELKVLDPLYVYDENGRYSDEINKIYGRDMQKGEDAGGN